MVGESLTDGAVCSFGTESDFRVGGWHWPHWQHVAEGGVRANATECAAEVLKSGIAGIIVSQVPSFGVLVVKRCSRNLTPKNRGAWVKEYVPRIYS